MNLLSSLPHTCNTRDLGGFLAQDGRVTRPGVLYRSDHLANTGAQDAALLHRWKVRTILDLRRDEELARLPTPRILQDNFTVRHFALDNTSFFAAQQNNSAFELWQLYDFMLLQHSAVFAAIVHCIVQALPQGGVLFHCSAGKDRTGLLACLLLHCAGVSEHAIADDYFVTQSALLKKPVEEIATIPPGLNPHFYRQLISCQRGTLVKTLERLNTYGGGKGYLLAAGVPPCELTALLQAFTP